MHIVRSSVFIIYNYNIYYFIELGAAKVLVRVSVPPYISVKIFRVFFFRSDALLDLQHTYYCFSRVVA